MKKYWLPVALGVAIPGVLALFARPEFATIFAPIAGPWAGHLYGHSGCTMANHLPSTIFLVVLGCVSIIGRSRAPQEKRWSGWAVLLAFWAFGWATSALLSVMNTLF